MGLEPNPTKGPWTWSSFFILLRISKSTKKNFRRIKMLRLPVLVIFFKWWMSTKLKLVFFCCFWLCTGTVCNCRQEDRQAGWALLGLCWQCENLGETEVDSSKSSPIRTSSLRDLPSPPPHHRSWFTTLSVCSCSVHLPNCHMPHEKMKHIKETVVRYVPYDKWWRTILSILYADEI